MAMGFENHHPKFELESESDILNPGRLSGSKPASLSLSTDPRPSPCHGQSARGVAAGLRPSGQVRG
jgi:hypothetical protein